MNDRPVDELDFDRVRMILMRSHSVTPHDNSVCADLLRRGGSRPNNVLHIDFTRLPNQRIAEWSRQRYTPESLSIISVDAVTRSAAMETGCSHPGDITLRSISDPSNLTQIGVEISKILHNWEQDDTPISVCLHSLTALLHYVDSSTTFQFLNILRRTLDAYDAVGHYHVEPGALDEQTIDRLRPVFDALVDVSVDGSVTIETRSERRRFDERTGEGER